jgi:hypothetical protein
MAQTHSISREVPYAKFHDVTMTAEYYDPPGPGAP